MFLQKVVILEEIIWNVSTYTKSVLKKRNSIIEKLFFSKVLFYLWENIVFFFKAKGLGKFGHLATNFATFDNLFGHQAKNSSPSTTYLNFRLLVHSEI